MIDDDFLKDIIITRRKTNYELTHRKTNIIQLQSPSIKIPFGIEFYAHKYIANLELAKRDKDDEVKQFYDNIKQIEQYFANFEKHANKENVTHADLLKDIKGKQFSPCLISRDYDVVHVRTHLKTKGGKIITNFNNKSKVRELTSKNKIDVTALWITPTNYGLTILLSECITE